MRKAEDGGGLLARSAVVPARHQGKLCNSAIFRLHPSKLPLSPGDPTSPARSGGTQVELLAELLMQAGVAGWLPLASSLVHDGQAPHVVPKTAA